ncbi:unnamed protein product, partial [Mesorhabditis belari]|uniref:Phospholipase A2 n=1 Tax=Mesorhabditis belari TaxID=2138241 RepID=A0AAF3F4S2_9BILA
MIERRIVCISFISSILFLFSPNFSLASPPPSVGALWNLEEVTECELHYNALVYNNYGCWCGIGGAHEPVDGIDKCCMFHDKCYDAAVDQKLCFDVAWEYVDDYSWKCDNGTALCAVTDDKCKAALCDCDKAVVECWKQFPKPTVKAKCNGVRRFLNRPQHFYH